MHSRIPKESLGHPGIGTHATNIKRPHRAHRGARRQYAFRRTLDGNDHRHQAMPAGYHRRHVGGDWRASDTHPSRRGRGSGGSLRAPGRWFATDNVDAVIEHCRVGGWPPKVSCGTVTCLAWTTTLRRTRSHPVDARQVMRSCIPNARVIRITVANVGLPSSDSAL